MGFGALLREARTQSGKSMAQLARHLAVSVVYVSDVEKERRTPFTAERIRNTAALLGIDPEPLFTAAAESRGSFELDAGLSRKSQEAGAALMLAWPELEDDELEEILQIARRQRRKREE